MLSFEYELHTLRAEGALDEAAATRLIAVERRELVSLHTELRLAMWVAVTMIATAAAWLLARNYERLGPAALIAIVGAAAFAAFAFAWKKRGTTAAEYAVLLGAMLLSADVGFAESQYHFFGDHWNRHFLILAVLHAVTAYRFDSRPVLSLAIAGLAAYFGVETRTFEAGAVPMLVSAALVFVWGVLHRRLSANRAFDRVFDHAAVWLAVAAAIQWLDHRDGRGTALLLALAVVCIVYAFRARAFVFAVYSVLCALIAVDDFLFRRHVIDEALIVLLSAIVAVVALRLLYARIRDGEAA